MPLSALGLPDHTARLLADADYENVGQVMETLALDENRLLRIEGFTSRDLDEVKKAIVKQTFPEPEPVKSEPATPEAEPEPAAAAPSEEAQEVPAPAAEASVAEAIAPTAEPETEAVGELVPAGEAEEEVEDWQDKDDEDEEDETGAKKKGKKKGKKRPAVEIEYDEELGVYITRKKRKASRGGEDFGDAESV
jgi:hypothetical protein